MYPLSEIYLIDTWMTVEDSLAASLNQSEANLKAGTLTMGWALDFVPDLGKDDAVALRVKQNSGDAGTVIFSGKISSRQGPPALTVTYTATNVIGELSRLPMVVGGETRFNLFRDDTGAVLNIGEQIAAALDYAAAQGIDVTYDQDEIDALDLDMPATEVSDITVYEIIKKALTYSPGIIVAVEYTAPGTDDIIRFVEQADLTTTTYNISECKPGSSASALYDRQVEGVVLTYKWTDIDENGDETEDSATDSYGTIVGVNVLRQDIELLGTQFSSSVSIPLHRFTPYTNQTSWSWNSDGQIPTCSAWEFWRGIALTGLATIWNIPPCWRDDFVPLVPEIKNIVWPELYSTSPANWVIYPADIPSDAWVIDVLANTYNSRPFVGECEMLLDRYNNYWPLIDITEANGHVIVDADESPIVLNSFSVPDDLPTGLAEQLYNILNPLQYDGQIIRYDDLTTPSGICSILRRLNIAGSENDLETMASIVQQCTMDHKSGLQRNKIGVPSHLEPQDFIALCRANRNLGNLRIA